MEIVAEELQWPLVCRAVLSGIPDENRLRLYAIALIPFTGRTPRPSVYDHRIGTIVYVDHFEEWETEDPEEVEDYDDEPDEDNFDDEEEEEQ